MLSCLNDLYRPACQAPGIAAKPVHGCMDVFLHASTHIRNLALKHSLAVINEHAQKIRRTAKQINGEKKYKIHVQILGLID